MSAKLTRMPLAAAIALAMATSLAWADDEEEEEVIEFDEANVYIEINATDGDAGLHALLDADAWKEVKIEDHRGRTIFEVEAKGRLARQGLTENFFESAEPVCDPDDAEPGDRVVPLAKFLRRFPPGTYTFEGETLDGVELESEDELTHALPAAPIITSFSTSMLTWLPGHDLGACQDDRLGLDPGSVPVVTWEVAVEPADDEIEPQHVFRVELAGDAPTAVTIPPEYVASYPGGTKFKGEVGAIEESGNRTFTEFVQGED